MTDREALVILAAGFADQEHTAVGAVEEAIAALGMIDAHLAKRNVPDPVQPLGSDADMDDILRLYDWLKVDGLGDYVDMRDDDNIVITKPGTSAGRWQSWNRPSTHPKRAEWSDSLQEACRKVDWDAWNQGRK